MKPDTGGESGYEHDGQVVSQSFVAYACSRSFTTKGKARACDCGKIDHSAALYQWFTAKTDSLFLHSLEHAQRTE